MMCGVFMPKTRLMLALLMAAAWLPAQDAPFLFMPANHSVVAPGPFRIAVKSEGKTELLLDGKPVAAVSPAPGVVRAEVTLTAGAHELVARNASGETKVEFFAGKQHADWPAFKQHPPVAACETCHAVKAGAWSLRRASLAPICASCHPQNRFPLIHTHNTDLLAECQNCHMPHGATAAKLLKMPKETACKQCHGQPQ